MTRPIVTLTTDFGTTDAFVGTMKGVILSVAPDCAIVDLTHDVPPQDVAAGAYLLDTAYRHFPAGTVHVIVVDPGVGTTRRAIAVSGPSATFVCPDNGLLSHVLRREGAALTPAAPFERTTASLPTGWMAYHLTNERYWHRPVSDTFHGRDIFAPVAANLAAGALPSAMGPAIDTVVAFAVPVPEEDGGAIMGCVLHVDRFGNVITNIEAARLTSFTIHVEVGGQVVSGLLSSYEAGRASQAEQDKGSPVALIGSHGLVEIAVPNDSAETALGVGVGAPVRLRPA
jgi:S-adenosylmethionine hydrolase